MAGNIPLVGLHDLICCYLCGHRALVKPSSQDRLLIDLLVNILWEIDPLAEKRIFLTDDLRTSDIDAIIATGSDNTNRYFKYQFGVLPGIIRSNRSSLGILRGDETSQQLQALGLDILSYFGRGCRNISKLLVPTDYDFNAFIDCNQSYRSLLDNRKYYNNYLYQKALYQVQQTTYIDTGYILLNQHEALGSPLSVLYYQYYDGQDQLKNVLSQQPTPNSMHGLC